MVRPLATKISISIYPDLLQRVDNLAKRDYTNRSDIVRLALLDYLRAHESNQPEPTLDQIEEMRRQFPRVAPDDIELLLFLTDNTSQQE